MSGRLLIGVAQVLSYAADGAARTLRESLKCSRRADFADDRLTPKPRIDSTSQLDQAHTDRMLVLVILLR